MNVVNLIGRITHDLELNDNGRTKWVNFQLAVANSKIEANDFFIKCVAFGKSAEFMLNWTGKGCKVALEGRLETSDYEVDGRRVKSYQVVVNHIEPIDWKKKKPETATAWPRGENPEAAGEKWQILDEDIPF